MDYKAPTSSASSKQSPYGQSAIPTGLKASFVQFGRGQRNELDDDDAAILVKQIRDNVKVEWEKEFASVGRAPESVSDESRRTVANESTNTDVRMTAKL